MTKTRGQRVEQPARSAGEGVYALAQELYLAYESGAAAAPGRRSEGIEPAKASFALSLKNPDKPAPPDAELKKEQEAEYPKD